MAVADHLASRCAHAFSAWMKGEWGRSLTSLDPYLMPPRRLSLWQDAIQAVATSLAYPILFYHIRSYPILSYPILSCPVLSCFPMYGVQSPCDIFRLSAVVGHLDFEIDPVYPGSVLCLASLSLPACLSVCLSRLPLSLSGEHVRVIRLHARQYCRGSG